MNIRLNRKRLISWPLVFVCLWMGSGGALCHTDRVFSAGQFASASAHLQSTLPTLAPDTCPACQWTQGVQSGTLAVSRLPLPVLLSRPHLACMAALAPARAARPAASRGPPASSTYC